MVYWLRFETEENRMLLLKPACYAQRNISEPPI